MSNETLRRSFVKSIVWRAIATASTFTIAYVVDNNVDNAVKISVLDCAINFSLYFLYERWFANIKWGYNEI